MTTELSGALYASADHLLREHGVVHRGDSPWVLDPLPLVIPAEEWHPLEAALVQRQELLNAILDDLTGERRLLTSGMLPAEIVASSPGFLRPAASLRLPGPHQLFCSATDLVRNADGAWTVLADRTAVPTGMGFAMEDRRVVAQVLTERYRSERVRHLRPFFERMLAAVLSLAPRGADAPRIALLTPGAESPHAFDHAHLAAMLGIPLVEGEDLVVQDGRLWSRSLNGREPLQPLDILVRRVDSAWIDPLELRGDSRLGTPGILHAVRRGTLTVVNSLGSGVLESPALFTFLPRLARHLLGEELALPSVATYWCGDRSMGAHVVANIHRLMVRSIHSRAPIDARLLSLGQRADLCARIASQPWAWVGQEPVAPSESPTLGPGGPGVAPTSLRMFAVSSGDGWTVMAGALGRVGDTALTAAAKDVWVLADEPTDAVVPPWPAPSSTVTPRSAEHLYWLGRHLEGAAAVTRLLRAVSDRWDDHHARARPSPDDAGRAVLDLLLSALRATAAATALPRLVFGEERGTVAAAIVAARGSARAVPDLLPQDTWPAFALVEGVLAEVREQHEGNAPVGPPGSAFLSRILAGLLALEGLMDESLVRDAGWQLLEAGRRIERALRTIDTLGALHGRVHAPAVERLLTGATLAALESVPPRDRRAPADVWELLLTDRSNPRSVAFQLERLTGALDALPDAASATRALLDDAGELLASTCLRRDEVSPDGERTALTAGLLAVRGRLRSVAADITRTWFARPELTEWPRWTS